ncbi:DAGAT-domain-containing protein [Cylindrobasidium torrendii FP15055 ss-10]|uniref:Diacylglycerol O-acyltransferase n=1 Tax=Cylindrobasidium torrendii FP15055 ss-10 TaxID=1314674 RepID=A0A0D7B6H5_9AGAR|nr:DAGAT-domain-containing protein [Cylindrobasidium torrendii FP15055 ss-10]
MSRPVLAPRSPSGSIRGRLSSLATLKPVKNSLDAFHFAPSTVPFQRRKETMAVAGWAILIWGSQTLFITLCCFPALWPAIAVYLFWIHFLDKAPWRGARPSPWFRSCAWWQDYAKYYPASLKKEADLPADRPYVFGYHPHGIIGMGAFATFATEATGWSKEFPGITPHLLTLDSNFKLPIYRDIALNLGVASVSKRSCTNILKKGAGQSVTIVVGGAAESLSARPGTADLTVKKRLGFIKLAITNGADLVPVFSFGENDIFDQMPNEKGTAVYYFQKRFQAIFGFTLPLFHGRAMLNYNLGLMPYRRPMIAVVGRPIPVTKSANPTVEEIQKIQDLYLTELKRIWDTYKDDFAKKRVKEMEFIE